jgi:hypothetical protein
LSEIEFLEGRQRKKGPTLVEAFEELRRICEEEGYTLEMPSRQERPNPFPDALDEILVEPSILSGE